MMKYQNKLYLRFHPCILKRLITIFKQNIYIAKLITGSLLNERNGTFFKLVI